MIDFAVVVTLCLAAGITLGIGWSKREALLELFETSYRTRYQVMARTPRIVDSYHVFHDDYDALARRVADDPRLVAIENTFPGGLARIDARPGHPDLVAELGALPGVGLVLKGNIPLICH